MFQEGVWADPRSRDTLYIFHAWGVLEQKLENVGFARELFKAAIKVSVMPLSSSSFCFILSCCYFVSEALIKKISCVNADEPQVDPKNDNVWATWISMEESLGLLDRADDLRIRQAEQQWEFEVRVVRS